MKRKKRPADKSKITAPSVEKNQDINRLRESEAKYRGFIENLPVMFYAAEPRPPYAPIYVSPAFERFGYPLEEWYESLDLWTRALHPDDRDWVLRETEAAMRAGGETDFEYRIVAMNGEAHWVRDRGAFVRNEQGEVICWQGIIIDITDRRRAEEALRESESRYRQMFLKNHAVKLLIDAETGAIIEANPAACDFYGYAAAEFKTKNIKEINTLPAEAVAREIEQARTERRDYFIFQHRLASGEMRDVEVHSSPLNDRNHNLLYSIIHDITERRNSEQRLKRSEELYRTLTHHIPKTAVLLFDCDFRYTLADGVEFEKHGYSREMIEGKTLREVFPSADYEEWADYYQRALSGETISFEKKTSGGYFHVYVVPVKNEDGEIFLGMVIWKDITARKLAENALRESERFYRALSEKSLGMICTHDLDGKLLSINRAAAKIMGYEPEELIDRTLESLVPPDAVELCRLYLKHIKTHGDFFGSFRVLTKTGEERILKFSNILYEEDGKPPFVLGNAQDITKLKRTEQELQTGNNLLNGIIEGTPDAVFVKDLAGRYLMINSAGASFYGKTPEEIVGRTDDEVYPPSMADVFIKADRKVLESGQTQTFEGVAAAFDGKPHTYLVTKAVYRNPQGEAIGLIGISHDITTRQRAEEALKESEERYRNLFENANDLIYIHDLRGNYLSVNKATERVFGYTREEALRMNIQDIAAPEHLNLARRMIADKIAGTNKTAYEVECIAKDGRRLTLEVNTSLIYRDDVPIAVQGIARDITERHRTELILREREEQYRDLFENANDLIYTHDLQGNFTSLNQAGEIITGYRREEALGMNIAEVVAAEDIEAAREMIANKVAGDVPTTYELKIIAKNGHYVSLELSTRVIYQNGQPIGVQGIGRDITERKRAEERLKISEQRYRSLGEGIMHQVWTTGANGKIEYVNGRMLEYIGCTIEHILGDNWQDVVHPDDLSECQTRWQHSFTTGENYEAEFRLKRYDGKYRWHQARATAGRDTDGEIINWFGTNSDIDDRKIAEAKINHLAGHDTLTNLPNRAKFMNHLERAVSRFEYDPATARFAVLFLDLDRFKVINDSLGHITGDNLLIAFAKRLEECVRPNDIVARLGGDEFTVLLNNVNESGDAVRVASRFLEKLSAPFKLDAYEVFTSASIGIIVSDEVKRQPEDYLRDADTAMYRAKESGKARYEIFDREMHIRNMNLLEMETDLRRAIEQNEFRVFYQPIVALDTARVNEFEALIRWQHPKHGLVMPNDFIEIAEETGLIIPIGRWILREACRQTVEWRRAIPNTERLSISVNLSAKQLMHPSLSGEVSEILRGEALPPGCLKLEVTESMVMENSEKALSVISDLHALGVSLSTDDFGTGYSSLSYLHRFPFDRLKIDRSFVSKMDTDEKSEAIVRTILLLGQNLNIEVVAEGIETESQREALRRLGCRKGQGYLFSKPVDRETATRFLSEGLPNNLQQPLFSFGETDERQVLEVDKIQ